MDDVTRIEPLALSVSRVIGAPRSLAYRTWADPRQLTHWFGPRGMTVPEAEMDLRPGGVFRLLMRDPAGKEYPSEGVFLEVVPYERAVFTDALLPGWRPSARAFMVATTSFEDRDDGTLVTMKAAHWNAADLREHEEMGFHPGWDETADRFVERVMQLAGERASP